MISILNVIVYALIVLIAIVLVVLILVQPSKDGGLGSAFGGLGENVFGAHAMDHLSKVTVWLISAFFVLALALTVLNRYEQKDDSVMAKTAVAAAAKNVEDAGSTKEKTPAAAEENAAEGELNVDAVPAAPAAK